MPAPTYTAGDTPQVIDSRDLIEWASYYCDDEDLDEDDRETLKAIEALEDEGVEDWQYGAAFIRDDYFTEHAQQLAEDIGAIDDNASWPMSYIDWEAAADALKQDYMSVEYLGQTYWVR